MICSEKTEQVKWELEKWFKYPPKIYTSAGWMPFYCKFFKTIQIRHGREFIDICHPKGIETSYNNNSTYILFCSFFGLLSIRSLKVLYYHANIKAGKKARKLGVKNEMSIRKKHPLADQTVKLKLALSSNPNVNSDPDGLDGQEFRIEDWAINIWDGVSWRDMNGNFAAMKYAMRAGLAELPSDDEVVYGKVGLFGHCVHVSELVINES